MTTQSISENAMYEYNNLVVLFNHNSRFLSREISLTNYLAMQAEYGAEDRSHLAKILSLRGIKL